jgi:hypothetical protein
MRRRLSTCRWCQAPIRWTITEKGHHLPIDPHPVTDGNLILDRSVAGPRVRAIRPGDKVGPTQLRWVAHAVTCTSRQAARARDRYAPHAIPATLGEQLEMPMMPAADDRRRR